MAVNIVCMFPGILSHHISDASFPLPPPSSSNNSTEGSSEHASVRISNPAEAVVDLTNDSGVEDEDSSPVTTVSIQVGVVTIP